MAIQKVDVTVPGGDTPRSANIKINANFSDTTHAASRLVGTEPGNVVTIGVSGQVGTTGWGGYEASTLSEGEVNGSAERIPTGVARNGTRGVDAAVWYANMITIPYTNNNYGQIVLKPNKHVVGYRYTETVDGVKGFTGLAEFYHTKNTTVDSNKNIKTSSPVLRVFADHSDKIHEANDLPIKYTRNGVGDYTIEGTTGLRENDWQIVIPKDDHDNQLIAFTMEDDNGTIRLKTYKRTFNMTTFMFEPDLKTPLDIPEGRWVDLHFNDLPQENLDDTQMEV